MRVVTYSRSNPDSHGWYCREIGQRGTNAAAAAAAPYGSSNDDSKEKRERERDSRGNRGELAQHEKRRDLAEGGHHILPHCKGERSPGSNHVERT